MNKYRVASAPKNWPETLPFRLSPIGHDTDYGVGDEFEHEFDSPADEQANLDSGLLEIVPRDYRVVGPTSVFETEPGSTFTRALTMGEEKHLVDAGHIARVVAASAAPKKRTTKQKED